MALVSFYIPWKRSVEQNVLSPQTDSSWNRTNQMRQGFQEFMYAEADHITTNFLEAVFHKFYLVHSWMPWPK